MHTVVVAFVIDNMAMLASNLLSQPHHFSRQNLDSTDGSVSMDSTDHYNRESPNIDDTSCCSDDTVLSVGNENPPPDENLSFKNIESHLNAISQITNSTLESQKSPSSPINHRLSPISTKSVSTSPTPSFLSRNNEYHHQDKSNPTSPEFVASRFRQNLGSPLSPSSPESSNRSPKLPETHQQQQHFYFHQNGTKTPSTGNNETGSGSLKFSIDNILKADFGRRITDPINIRKSKPSKKVVQETIKQLEDTSKSGPVDLSKADADKGGKTESGSQPMLWPAWVYCTRYSDRPSSGNFPSIRILHTYLFILGLFNCTR